MVTAVPALPTVGVKLAMVGTSEGPTVKAEALVTEPVGVVILMVPVVAPAGTLATILVVVADITVATVRLNVTVF